MPTPIKLIGERTGHREPPKPLKIAGRPQGDELDTPPEDLPRAGKEMWAEIVPVLCAVGIVDRVDRYMLEELCRAHARRVQFSRVIASEGLFSAGSHGQLRQHPAVAGERAAADEFRAIAASFGLDPVGRVRLGVAELHRKSLASELEEVLGPVKLVAVDSTGVYEDDLP